MLMTAQTIAKLLRGFLNSNQLTLSDIRKGMVVLSNGKLGDGKVRGEAQKPVRNDSRASQPKTRMNIDPADAEHCLS